MYLHCKLRLSEGLNRYSFIETVNNFSKGPFSQACKLVFILDFDIVVCFSPDFHVKFLFYCLYVDVEVRYIFTFVHCSNKHKKGPFFSLNTLLISLLHYC